jgi:hypothetical protein
VWNMASNISSYPASAAAGDISMFPGQRFAMATPGSLFMYFMQGTPTASRIITWPDAAGTVALYTGSPANNDCAKFSVSGGVTTLVTAGAGCGSGGGTINNASQFSDVIYSAAGSSNFLSGIAAPTITGKWFTGYSVTAGVAVTKATYQSGLTVTSGLTGATSTYTVTFTDCSGQEIVHDKAGSSSITVTLPTPTVLTNPGCVFAYDNHSASNDTITPNGGFTIQGNATAAGASVSVPSGLSCRVSVDPNNASNWLAQCSVTSANATSVNGASVPASTTPLSSNGSSQLVATTAHGMAAPLRCLDSSGSGTAQLCTTTPSFTPAAGDMILYRTTTTNTAALTLNANSSSAAAVQKWEGTALLAGDVKLGVDIPMTFDGTNWQAHNIGNKPLTLFAPITTSALNTASIASAACNTLTVAVTGATTSDVPTVVYQGDVTGQTGYVPSTNGTLYTYAFMTSGNINFKTCNNTNSPITPGAVTAIWYIAR